MELGKLMRKHPHFSAIAPTRRLLPLALSVFCFWPSGTLAQETHQQYLEHWKNSTDPLEQWVFANGQKTG